MKDMGIEIEKILEKARENSCQPEDQELSKETNPDYDCFVNGIFDRKKYQEKLKRKRIENVKNNCGIPSCYMRELNPWVMEPGNEGLIELGTRLLGPKVKRYHIKEFLFKGSSIILKGAPGTGKTRLLCQIGLKIIDYGYDVHFINDYDLSEVLNNQSFSYQEKVEKLIDDLKHVDVLIWDEIGRGSYTDIGTMRLKSILEYRYNNYKSIFATSNFELNELDKSLPQNEAIKKLTNSKMLSVLQDYGYSRLIERCGVDGIVTITSMKNHRMIK